MKALKLSLSISFLLIVLVISTGFNPGDIISDVPGVTSSLAQKSNYPAYYTDYQGFRSSALRIHGIYQETFETAGGITVRLFSVFWLLGLILAPSILVIIFIIVGLIINNFIKKNNLAITPARQFAKENKLILIISIIVITILPLVFFLVSVQNPESFILKLNTGEIKVMGTPEYYLALIVDLIYAPFVFILFFQILRILKIFSTDLKNRINP